ncbi:hypothetical protein PAXRUDRAFT_22631 [Paxillus rubicundulus Ve08.2h10]|uniref:Uncharacterized protein n=1 Tax=Paxillus rubicundulus Ve08.2h10 TaxID=930991 RepID=A0A0D0D527_9AGAM|nr:hypothetical protein PAXRUDRAFT_22631 [Paxillus rubicundulus Ve08.2h10]
MHFQGKSQERSGVVMDGVIFRAAQVNSASPEPTLDQVHFLRPPFLRSSAFPPSP